jgi:hypothetical protein
MLEEQQRAEQSTRHFANHMATIVHKTTKELSRTKDTVNRTIETTQIWRQKQLTKESINFRLLVLETVRKNIEEYRQWTYQVLHELETGHLGERILPRNILEEVFIEAKAYTLASRGPMWYYTHCRINVKVISADEIIFTTELPMVRLEQYLIYEFHTIPVPDGNKTHQLQVVPRVAYNTVSGGTFVPNLCTGTSPYVCRTGPVYHNRYLCELGLINAHAADRQKCSVEEIDFSETRIVENRPGVYIVATNGEEYSVM